MSDPRPQSAPVQAPDLPATWRPIGPRIVGIVLSISMVVICVAAGIALGPEERAKFTYFQRGTLVFVGLLAGSTMYALLRSRAVATVEGLLVVNGYRKRQLSWAEIVAVHLRPGAPWVTLDLADGSALSVLAIQSSDGQRAKTATHQLRILSRGPSQGQARGQSRPSR